MPSANAGVAIGRLPGMRTAQPALPSGVLNDTGFRSAGKSGIETASDLSRSRSIFGTLRASFALDWLLAGGSARPGPRCTEARTTTKSTLTTAHDLRIMRGSCFRRDSAARGFDARSQGQVPGVFAADL